MRVGPGVEYSQTFSLPMAQLTDTRPKRLRISGWFYRTTPEAHASLVLQVVRPGRTQNMVWEALDLAPLLRRPRAWTYAERTVTIPAAVAATDECRFYLWGPGSTADLLADDLAIDAID